MLATRYRLPRHPIAQLREEMDKVFSGLLSQPLDAWRSGGARPGQPAVNMWEEPERFCVEMEVPGLKQDQLELAVAGGELSIRVDRPEVVEQGATYHRRERPVGTFARVIRLPSDIDGEKVDAKLADGVLTVLLPKSQAAQPRKIQVSPA